MASTDNSAAVKDFVNPFDLLAKSAIGTVYLPKRMQCQALAHFATQALIKRVSTIQLRTIRRLSIAKPSEKQSRVFLFDQ
jgi:hypothetical protein